MIRPEEIPDEVAIIADNAYYDIGGLDATMSDKDIMKYAIAAALNNWVDMEGKGKYTMITLPLEQA